jgi:hypothetical protein
MCAFVPMNIPIAFGLLCLPPTQFNIMLFNFINQSYNAMMNYANSSGTEDSVKYVSASYALAVISSIGTGVILKKRFSRNTQQMGIIKEGLIRIVPSMVAGFLNLFFMRSDYITKGINIKDEKGNVLGTSKRCGAKALMEGALSRMFIPIPMIINHFALKGMGKLHLPKKISTVAELTFCGIALGVGLPCSIAIFKENAKMKSNFLEEPFKTRAKENKSDFIYYNKGL